MSYLLILSKTNLSINQDLLSTEPELSFEVESDPETRIGACVCVACAVGCVEVVENERRQRVIETELLLHWFFFLPYIF